MSRYSYTSEADAQRYLKAQQGGQQPRTEPRRPTRRIHLGTVLSGVQLPGKLPDGGYLLIYPHDVPKSHGTIHQMVRYGQKKRAMEYFGILLPQDWCQVHAYVTITRVQGPRQHDLDDENLYIGCKGLRDSLKACGYIKNDNRRWTTFEYKEEAGRRHDGPRIEVLVRYKGAHNTNDAIMSDHPR